MANGEHEGNSTSDEAPAYLRTIQLHREHPVVKKWFFQIKPCELMIPGQGSASFRLIEFRDGRFGALVWSDGQGHWGTGGWRQLSDQGLMDVDISYLQDAPVAGSFPEVLELVAARHREVAHEPSQGHKWWRFWR